MIPTFATPGEITPGQFGPTRVVSVPARYACTTAISRTGMPSVMQTVNATPASAASKIPAAANRGGTEIIDVLAPVSATASETVSNTGMPSTSCPPLPGVTPATTDVPCERLRSPWNLPSEPVSPWTTSRVLESTRIATLRRPRQLDGTPRPVEHRRLGVEVRRRSLQQDPPPLLGVRPVEAHDDRVLDRHLLEGLQDPARDLVAARDPAEDVEEDR